MARKSAEAIALTILTVGEVPNWYSGMLPSLWTIGHFSHQDIAETTHWIRKGEIIATILALSAGIAVSQIAESSLPFWGTVIMAAVLLSAYEHALKNPTGRVA